MRQFGMHPTLLVQLSIKISKNSIKAVSVVPKINNK
jgi:hypothetical protein